MNDKQLASTEIVLKEYPKSTRWVEGQQVIGVGNLILTNKRLIFLHQVSLSDQQIEKLQELSKERKLEITPESALALHKKNFQVPLTSVVSVKVGLYSLLPFPRPCLRIFYQGAKKNQIKTASFMFTIPLLRGLSQLEITDVLSWVWKIRRAVSHWR